MANSKFMSQVQAVSNTGLNFAATGVGQKAAEPKTPASVHNRGITVGGKLRAGGGAGHVMTPKANAAVHAQNPQPKISHPAMAKNDSNAKPGVKWG